MTLQQMRDVLNRSPLGDSITHALIATDPHGTIISWNKSAERAYGWRAYEVEGRNVIDVTPTDVSRRQAEEIMAVLRTGRKWSGTFSVRRRDGSIFLAFAIDVPICERDGTLIGIVGLSSYAFDVTDLTKDSVTVEGVFSSYLCEERLPSVVGVSEG